MPAVAVWPGTISAGRTVTTPVCTLDYLPTVAGLLNDSMPDGRPIDGVDISPLLRGDRWQRRKGIPFASRLRRDSPDAAWIWGDYKFCTNITHAGEDALYHLHDDPGEDRNIISQHPDLAAKMKQDLLDWLESARHSYSQGDYPGYEPQGNFLVTERK